MSQLRLYNTASRSVEPFTLPEGQPFVRIYCCGPTVYHFAHIGNLRTYIFEDILRRTLQYFGFAVKHVVNITDVGHLTSDEDEGEDKMEKGAARTGKTVWEVADFYTQAFQKDIARLNILEPSVWCKATDHIQEQIDLVLKLETKGYTYQTSDGVYFDSSKFKGYADFAKLDIESLQEGSRIDMGEKKNVTDFALWKFSPVDSKRAMEWPSPWGKGFPGWHIECSAMAQKHLGETLDIHCGGTDHVRIHHTNEIAQSECANDAQFSRFWMHGEFLRMGESAKMSKSSGEFLTLDVLIRDGYHPMEYRLLALTSHYRNYLNFSIEAIDNARESLKSLRKKTDPLLGQGGSIGSTRAKEWQTKFREAMGDDLNTSKALGILNMMLKDDLQDYEKSALVRDFDIVLGLGLGEPLSIVREAATVDSAKVEALLVERTEARKNKDFKTSDRIRDELAAMNVVIKDGPSGTSWELK
jgi:cysteinyl-tRNA synthetase